MKHALLYKSLADQSELGLQSASAPRVVLQELHPPPPLPHLYHHPSSLQSGDGREGGWTEPRVDTHEGENIGRVYGADTGRGEQRGGGGRGGCWGVLTVACDA